MFKTIASAVLVTLFGSASAGSSAEDPGIFVNETWYSGLIDIDTHNDDIFYWWFESRSAPDTDPVVLWLTGGPGCASELALFFENGPYKFDGEYNAKLKTNPHSWNNNANLLYVDQPVGTGFSKAGPLHMDTNEDEIAETMAQFMIKFVEEFPQLEGRDFYITGESYAGHYIPSIAHNFIFNHADDIKMNFKGIAIGNGLVDPYLQYPEYATFAYEEGLLRGEKEYNMLVGAFKGCQTLIETGIWLISTDYCQLFVEIILGNPFKPKFNVYDIRETCDTPPLCYDFSAADHLFRLNRTKEVLGVEGRYWQECSTEVHMYLLGDWMIDYSDKVTDILNSGLEVLVYSGDKDFICNWRGGEAWTNAVDWDGAEQYALQDYGDWMVGDAKAGELKSYANLKFLKVLDAGHMVPMNQPEFALEMLSQFMSGGVSTNQNTTPVTSDFIQG